MSPFSSIGLATFNKRVTRPWALIAAFSGLLILTPLAADPQVDDAQLRQHMMSQYGEGGLFVMNEWQDLLRASQGLSEREQLTRVNDFFNQQVDWVEDIDNWGYDDYWATPMETLAAAQGDCEDYSIGKYVTLRLLGVPESKLRMIYVNARLPSGSQAHMVLGYFETPNAEPLILDNINPEILPASQRPDLSPVFSFNSEGLWVGGQQDSAADPTARLSRWRSVLSRMQSEGFQL